MFKRHHHLLMSALGVALSAGGAAVASAFDAVEKFVVTGALKVTHTITEQVCEFSTVDQLEAYLTAVEDRHNWFRHDQPATAPLTDDAGQLAAPMSLDAIVGEATAADQIDTTAAQVESLATVAAEPDPAPAPPVEAVAGPAVAAEVAAEAPAETVAADTEQAATA